MSHSQIRSPAHQTRDLEYGLTKLVDWCRTFDIPQSDTEIAENSYKGLHNAGYLKRIDVSAIVAACAYISSPWNARPLLHDLHKGLNAPMEDILQALWLLSNTQGYNTPNDIPMLVITFESSQSTIDTYSAVGKNGIMERMIITLSLPGHPGLTSNENLDNIWSVLLTLRDFLRDMALPKWTTAQRQNAKKIATLLKEVPTTKDMVRESKVQQHKVESLKTSKLISSQVVTSMSARTFTTPKTSKNKATTIPIAGTKTAEKAKKVKLGSKATEEEADWDVISPSDHDDIVKQWVKLDGQKLRTAINGRRGWTSGLKKFFG